jgi:hypothetical protein
MMIQKIKIFFNSILRSNACLPFSYGAGQYLVGNPGSPSKGSRDRTHHWRWRSNQFVFYISLFGNKYVVAGITGGMCFIADLLIHPTHFGSYTTEAIVTGAVAAIISLTVNFVGKKFFMYGRSKLTKN